MALIPDPDVLLAVADRITRHATSIRRHAHLLGWSVGHGTWRGTAARTFAVGALEVCSALRRSADRLDAAAAALRRHAARVRAALADLARAAVGIAHAGVGLVHAGSAALHVAGGAVGTAGAVTGHVLDAVGI